MTTTKTDDDVKNIRFFFVFSFFSGYMVNMCCGYGVNVFFVSFSVQFWKL